MNLSRVLRDGEDLRRVAFTVTLRCAEGSGMYGTGVGWADRCAPQERRFLVRCGSHVVKVCGDYGIISKVSFVRCRAFRRLPSLNVDESTSESLLCLVGEENEAYSWVHVCALGVGMSDCLILVVLAVF